MTRKELPYGFTAKKGSVDARPDYPTADDGHAVLGVVALAHPLQLTEEQEEKIERANNFQKMGLRREFEKPLWEALRPEIERLAASKGANAILPRDGTSFWALYISPSRPAPGPDTKTLLRSVIPTGHREVARSTLAMAEHDPGSVTANVRRGRCYTLAFAMTPEAVRGTGRGLGYIFEASRPQGSGKLRPIPTVGGIFSDGVDGIETRAALAPNSFCPLVSEDVTWQIRGSSKRPAGDGDAVVVLLERRGKANEVRDVSCAACQPDNVGCSSQLTHAACKASTTCLRELSMTPAQCP